MFVPPKLLVTLGSLVVCGILGLVFVSVATPDSYRRTFVGKKQVLPNFGDAKQQNARPTTTKNIKDRFPKVDYDAPEPTDPVERTKRRNKGKHFDGLGGVSKEPTRYSSALSSHWDLDLPSLPVAQSDAVIIAKTLTRGAFLSNDKSGIYTELTVKVEEVLKTDDDSVTRGSLIDITRLGGVVRYRTGEESLFMIVGQNMPEAGKRYLVFLKAIKDSQDFQIITAYELAPSGVNALDTPSQFSQYNGVDEASLMNNVRSAIAGVKQ